MQLLVNVIVLASLYSLICCGYVLVYRASRVLNLAHGEIMTLGGYFLLSITMATTANPFVSVGLAVVLSLVVGLAVYFGLMRFMAGESVFAAVLVTIALGILLRGLTTLIWTSQSWHPTENLGLANTGHHLFGTAVISTFGIAAILSATLLYAALFICLKFTRWGLRMRAVGENPLLASQRGIDIHKYYALSWGLAAFSGGVAGIIMACDSGLEPNMFVIGLMAFPVGTRGGIG